MVDFVYNTQGEKAIPTKPDKYHPARKEGIVLTLGDKELVIAPNREGLLINVDVLIGGERFRQHLVHPELLIEGLNNLHIYFNRFPLDGAEIHPSIRRDREV